MEQYHKIQGLFKRDLESPLKSKPIIFGEYSLPEFEYLENNIWIGTEKVDGTNIRIIYKVEQEQGLINRSVEFKAKTDNGDIPKHLLSHLNKIFSINKLQKVFGDNSVTLYGEGYGIKIQSGGGYISNGVDFILFDIKIGHFWLKRIDIENLVDELDIKIVPLVFSRTIKEGIEYVKSLPKSLISEDPNLLMEGIVITPKVPLLSRSRERIITKIKHKDFNI